MPVPPADCLVDLTAVQANLAVLRQRAAPAAVLAVVKADGYGHGMLPVARAAVAGGADWLGVAWLSEALALRAAGLDVPVLAWLFAPGDDLAAAVAAGVDLSVSARWTLTEAAAAASAAGTVARLHLKVDTGLGRGGAAGAGWPDLVDAAAKAQADGTVRVVGLWSHLAFPDEPAHPTVSRQLAAFAEARSVAERAGLAPEVCHLAGSGATLALPAAHLDLVRPGLAVYGLSPGPAVGTSAALGLRPAMTLRARVTLAKRLPAGHGVSYGHRYTTRADTTAALVPLGYADGVPRSAGNLAQVALRGRRYRVAGTVCMDQFLIDVGDDPVRAGDEVLLFGPGDHGEPTADEWAAALGTINYEIVTRVGARVPRVYRGGPTGEGLR